MGKYVFTDGIKTIFGVKLRRIKSTRKFGDVKRGQLGGYIENKKNLSELGNCWVYDDALVFDDVRVTKNAKVKGTSRVWGAVILTDDAQVSGNARVRGTGEYKGGFTAHDIEIY